MHCSLTVLALICLYGGHCSSVQPSSKVMLRLPVSHNHGPQQMTMFSNDCFSNGICLCVVAGIDGVGLAVSRNGAY